MMRCFGCGGPCTRQDEWPFCWPCQTVIIRQAEVLYESGRPVRLAYRAWKLAGGEPLV